MMKETNVKFSMSLLFFWIKGSVSVDQRAVKVSTANVLLGCIPAGKNDQTIPLRNISSSKISTAYNLKEMLIGLLAVFIGLGTVATGEMGGIWFALIGIALFLGGIKTAFMIQRSGNNYFINVPFYEKKKIVEIRSAIEEGLNYESDKVDLGNYFTAKN